MMDVPSEEDFQQQVRKKSKKKLNKCSDVVAARMVPAKDNKGKCKISTSSAQDSDDLLDVYIFHCLPSQEFIYSYLIAQPTRT